ncbi:MAG: hypothetical protein Q9162_007880 [Coniocarpon cinnabarinum]
MSDLDTLKDMGFDPDRASLAVKAGGNLQGAIDWLERNQEKSLEELQSSAAEGDGDADAPPPEGANSLICNECGKKFRGQPQAEFHASKSGHTDFSESTEELAPLTDEERKVKLEELKAKRDQKRADQAKADKEALKRNEEIRRKSTKEQQDAKDELKRKEQMKDAEKKKREKLEDIEAKKRIQAKIAADKEERKRKAEADKAAREGKQAPPPVKEELPTSSGPSTSKTTSEYTETRLRVQTSSGNFMKAFKVETTLFEVAQAVNADKSVEISSLVQNFPKKTFDQADWGMSLKEAGLVPSAALIAN